MLCCSCPDMFCALLPQIFFHDPDCNMIGGCLHKLLTCWTTAVWALLWAFLHSAACASSAGLQQSDRVPVLQFKALSLGKSAPSGRAGWLLPPQPLSQVSGSR